MHYLLIFNFWYFLCGCNILFCNGKYMDVNYDFITVYELRGILEKLSIHDAKHYCRQYRGKLAYMSSKYLNDKAKQQLYSQLTNGAPYFIDLRLTNNGLLIWGDGKTYDRKTTPDFVFGDLETASGPCVIVVRTDDKFHIHFTECNILAQAICLIHHNILATTSTTTTTTTTSMTTTTTITTTATTATITTTTTTTTTTTSTTTTTTTTKITIRTTTTTITTTTTATITTTTTTTTKITTRTTTKTIKTTATTVKTIDSKFTMTQQTLNNTTEENIFNERFFPAVLAIIAGITFLIGLLCYACYLKRQNNYLSYKESRYPGYYKRVYSGPGYTRKYNNNKYG